MSIAEINSKKEKTVAKTKSEKEKTVAKTKSEKEMTVAEIKDTLRRDLAEKRRGLSAEEKKELSDRLCKNICSLDLFKEADAVLSFFPLSSETDVSGVNEEVLRLGKTLLLPKCVKGTREMNFHAVKSFDDLERGSFSVMEPKGDCPIFTPSKEVKALCIVPALAYDGDGYRLGYGGGFYDRYLSRHCVKTVGAVYHIFLTDNLPRDRYDIAVDTVVTDREIIKIKNDIKF